MGTSRLRGGGDEDLTRCPLLATAKRSLSVGPVELAVLGGVGGYLVVRRTSVRMPSSLASSSFASTAEKVGLGLHAGAGAGAGVGLRRTRRFRLEVGARYVVARTNPDVKSRFDHAVVLARLVFAP